MQGPAPWIIRNEIYAFVTHCVLIEPKPDAKLIATTRDAIGSLEKSVLFTDAHYEYRGR